MKSYLCSVSIAQMIAASLVLAVWAFVAPKSPHRELLPEPSRLDATEIAELRQLAPFQDYPEDGKPHHDPNSLPRSVRDMLSDAVKYRPAMFTQKIHEDGSSIERMSRTEIYRHWNVPGGLENVWGWKSDLYRFAPTPPKVWIDNIALPISSTGLSQHGRAYKRSYADGTWFADVLSSEGKVFEVRVREKYEGSWSYYVMWKNKSARPYGYSGVKQSCLSCHSLSGTGMSDQGLVPGGDETMSEPFPALMN